MSDSSGDAIKNLPLEVSLYEELIADRPIRAAIEVLVEVMRSCNGTNPDNVEKAPEPIDSPIPNSSKPITETAPS